VPRTCSSFEGVGVTSSGAIRSPSFIFSERRIRERVRSFPPNSGRRFAEFTVAWSYKTTTWRGLHDHASGGRLGRGRFRHGAGKGAALGGARLRFLFNGPGKSANDLTLAFRWARVHIDHLDELASAEHVASTLGAEPEVGIRLNLTGLPVPAWDRFGFNLENGSALHAVQRIQRGGRLKLKALHCHIGTFVLDADAYRWPRAPWPSSLPSSLPTRILIDTLDWGALRRATLCTSSICRRRAGASLASTSKRSPPDSAKVSAAPSLRASYSKRRALIDDAGVLIATVIGTKRLADGRRAVILDAGVNLLPTAFWYRHDVRPAGEVRGVPNHRAGWARCAWRST